MLSIGTKAPDFTLKNQNGDDVSLSQFSGKRVVLYFYPRDNTPGCTRQAWLLSGAPAGHCSPGRCDTGNQRRLGGLSYPFCRKIRVNLPAALRSQRDVIKAYDVWKEKKMYGKVSMGVVRSTYVIDANGVIEQAWEKVKPDQNPTQALEYLQQR